MNNWYNSLSIRWKLQFGFFMVTMVTTVYNRMLASHELGQMVDIAREGGVAQQVIDKLVAKPQRLHFQFVLGVRAGVRAPVRHHRLCGQPVRQAHQGPVSWR